MTAAIASTEAITVTAPKPAEKSHLWDGASFGFTDLLGALNPLQHIPIISTIYRAVTGDTIGNVARVVGDGIYGGLLGVASGAIDVAATEATGKDIGQHVLDTIEDLFSSDKSEDQTAPAQPVPQPASPLVAAARAEQEQPKLPLLGSASTAGELAAAAPISPLTAPKLAAQVEAQAQAQAQNQSQNQSQAAGAIRPLKVAAGQPIPIDVSPRGIAMMRATSAMHNSRPVALNLPAGALPSQGSNGGTALLQAASSPTASAQPPATSGTPLPANPQGDFAEKMRQGLAKYDALMAAQARAGQSSPGQSSPGPSPAVQSSRVDQLH